MLYKLEAFHTVVDCVIELGFPLIHLGDVFERPNPPDVLRDLVMREFQRVCDAGLDVILVGGNHDATSRSLAFTSEAMGRAQFFIVGDYLPLRGEEAVHFLSHTASRWTYGEWEAFVEIAHGTLFGHLTVEGGRLASSNHLLRSWLAPSLFEGFDLCVLGDLHLRQRIGRNIHYIGSLFRHNFGEEGHPTGYAVVTDGNLEYHDLPDWEFVTATLDEKEDAAVSTQIGDALEGRTPSAPGCVVRIRFSGSRPWLRSLDVEGILRKVASVEEVEHVEPNYDIKEEGHVQVAVEKGTSMEELVVAYGEERSVDERTVELGLGFLREAGR